MTEEFNKVNTDLDAEFEKARKESIKKAFSTENKENEKNLENPEKKLDFDQKNSYISEDEKLLEIFEKQFNKDGTKAVKSWKETSSALDRLKNEYNKIQNQYQSIEQILEKNPKLADLVEKAYKGEDIQNFFEQKNTESKDKLDNVRVESKLTPDKVDVNTDELVSRGYISKVDLEYMTPEQKSYAIRQAKLAYIEDTLPERITEKAAKRIEELEKQRQLEAAKQKNIQTNIERYEKGIDTILAEYKLDLDGEHKDLVAEINQRAKFIRDPHNPDLISSDAVFLATQATLMSKGIQVERRNTERNIEDAKRRTDDIYYSRFDTNTRHNSDNKPKTLADKLRDRKLQQFDKEVNKRFTSRRDMTN